MESVSERVLVTGASGFVGREIVRALAERGSDVHTLGRTPLDHRGIRHHVVDLFDAAAVDGLIRRILPSAVVHAAWYADHGRFWEAPVNLRWIEATGSLALAAHNCGVARFVGIGSMAEYAPDSGAEGLIRETAPIQPASLYGHAKARARELARDILHSGSFAWARLFHLCGPGEPPQKVTSYLAQELAAGRAPVIQQPETMLDILDVRYVGDAIAALALNHVEGPINIARGEGISVFDLACLIAERCGWRKPIRRSATGSGVAASQVADVSRLRNELDFPPAAPLRDSLAYLCGEWRAEGVARG